MDVHSEEFMTKKIEQLSADSSLNELQEYIAEKIQERGFTKETTSEAFLVMLEEVGELAKALRKQSGIAVDHERLASYGNLKHEFGDVFICLLILACKCDINIFEAFSEKEAINSKRVWR